MPALLLSRAGARSHLDCSLGIYIYTYIYIQHLPPLAATIHDSMPRAKALGNKDLPNMNVVSGLITINGNSVSEYKPQKHNITMEG